MDAILKAQKDGVVLGLKGISAQPVPRLDIDDLLFYHPDTFNLFLIAITELQDDKLATEKMAWQQVTGIHGLPRAPWDNVTSKGMRGWGYCAHARPTFPTWHRPYLSMMEQTLYVKMAEIAEKYPEGVKPKYREALKAFRLPYWDYYRPRGKASVTMPGIVNDGGTTTTSDYDFGLPQIFVVDQVMIRHYNKKDELHPYPNPLKNYKFPSSGGLAPEDWVTAKDFNPKQTVRYPARKDDLDGNLVRQSEIINRERESNVSYILHLIQNYDSYGEFASEALTTRTSGNLEDIHGTYHVLMGGGSWFGTQRGHISWPPTAAFDPLFWMHHCQIDRWFAIWQAAHPVKWYDGSFKDTSAGNKVMPIPPLATEDALPFRKPQGGYWNGDLSRDTKTFGYIYSDAVKGSPQEVLDNFERLYGWARRKDPQGDKVVLPNEFAILPIVKAQVFSPETAPLVLNLASKVAKAAPHGAFSAMASSSATNGHKVAAAATVPASAAESAVDTAPVAPDNTTSSVAFRNLAAEDVESTPASIDESQYRREWFVDNIVQRLALNGAFAIFYFIGDFDKDDVSSYAVQPTMAGLSFVFAAPREACDNCGLQADDEIEVTGTKIITPMLLDYIKVGTLPDLTPANVVPFLIKNLKWRIVDAEGNLQNPRSVAGFRVGLSSSLNPLSGDGGPIYEEYPQVIEQIIANAD